MATRAAVGELTPHQVKRLFDEQEQGENDKQMEKKFSRFVRLATVLCAIEI